MSGCIALKKTVWQAYWWEQVGGAKPPISPLSPTQARVAIDQQLQAVAAQQPIPTRWCLRRILAACSGIVLVRSLRGLLGVLRRLKITRQRARGYVHSPDEQYDAKLKAIHKVLSECDNKEKVVVFADELTYYSQPSVAPDYALTKEQPHRRSD